VSQHKNIGFMGIKVISVQRAISQLKMADFCFFLLVFYSAGGRGENSAKF
jgi:hypothetical protein